MTYKILFLNTVHKSFDDRVFYHQAKALSDHNHQIYIFSTQEKINTNKDGIIIVSDKLHHLKLNEQSNRFYASINQISPDIIICDSPIAVLLAFKYHFKKKSKIIYDITEWYPSRKNSYSNFFLFSAIKFTGLIFINLLAGCISDKLIFGEHYKSLPFSMFFWKKRIFIDYYPDLRYIRPLPPVDIKKSIRLYYSGWFNNDKGIIQVLLLARKVAETNKDMQIELNLTGEFNNENDRQQFEDYNQPQCSNLKINISGFKSFEEFCTEITNADIFIDLRKNDFENTHCLPIKLFYYLACGRPVIYSDLKSIHKVMDISNFGVCGNPNDTAYFTTKINEYIQNPDLYKLHCDNATKIAVHQFNWNLIKDKFVHFVLN